MKMFLNHLELTCKKSIEKIEFTDFSYFYGEMGAGKSTIARLIDYCLGSKQLVMTPALQNEFVSVALELQADGKTLRLDRERDSGQLVATWDDEQVIIPARKPGGHVVPNTEVEVLSDLVFHINGIKPPRVRRSQTNEDSDLERLSLRDLWWYSYLDQDSMDSSFFYLDRDAEPFRRLKSRNVLRSILGVHQEKVAELEQRLEETRRERLKYSEGARVLEESLDEADVSSEVEITGQLKDLKEKLKKTQKHIKQLRREKKPLKGHATDRLRKKARHISTELEAVEATIGELGEIIGNDKRHLNEILVLSTKVRRLESARAVLNDVDFESCPRCTQSLPDRPDGHCPVCGQSEYSSAQEVGDEGEETQADLKSRVSELEEILDAQTRQLRSLRRRRESLSNSKKEIDDELNKAMKRYDSAFLSDVLSAEQRRASLTQEIRYLQKLNVLPARVEKLKKQADQLQVQETTLRRQLNEARSAAEQDLSNLEKLKDLFLDCLLRSKVAGFEPDDVVSMKPPWFLPEVIGRGSGDMATTSFSTLGSGGKKNLFKCCFALAVHRLAAELGTLLPSVLVIDSPMKNISERENREQFEGFHQLLYELKEEELNETQMMLIDKEYCPPKVDVRFKLNARHMKVDSNDEPPLIGYYRGK